MKYFSFSSLSRVRLPVKQVCLSTRRGFTLIEILIAMAVFSLMMASVSQIFSTTFIGYRNTRAVQRDIDNAQYSLNILAKELRTSSIVVGSGSVTDVRFFDHSQGKCFRYRISGGNLQVASADTTDAAACLGATLSAFTTISTGVVTGSFQVTPSAASLVGRVTISLDISEGSTHHARIQTSVSLRDFSVSGI